MFGTLTYRITAQFDLTGGLHWLENKQYVDEQILPGAFVPGSHSYARSAET
jgi:hypothetical protein